MGLEKHVESTKNMQKPAPSKTIGVEYFDTIALVSSYLITVCIQVMGPQFYLSVLSKTFGLTSSS